jgi:acetone monooxygenase
MSSDLDTTISAGVADLSVSSDTITLDAAIVGAGVAGLYQLHLLRQQGLRVKAFDTASDIGGTWYWNRYL